MDPVKKRGRGRPKKPVIQTHQVTFRMAADLYQKLHRIAESLYQSDYVVFRMALAEFAKNHRPAKHQSQGISLVFPIPPEDLTYVTPSDTPVSPDEPTT